MRYTFALAFISLGLASMGFVFPSAWPLWAWSSVSFGHVAAGYALRRPGVFGKRKDGSMPLVFKVINFPYLAYTWVIWNLWRCVCREDAFNEISAELAVGRRLLASELSHDFDYYVDLTSEFEEPKKIRVHTGYRCLPVLDTRCPSHGELAGLLKEVSRGKTFVHCAQGHGRTGLFAAALLLYSGRATSADEALAALKKIRPSIGLSAEQQSFLKKWELDTVSSLDTPLCQFDRSQVSKQPRMIRSSPPSP